MNKIIQGLFIGGGLLVAGWYVRAMDGARPNGKLRIGSKPTADVDMAWLLKSPFQSPVASRGCKRTAPFSPVSPQPKFLSMGDDGLPGDKPEFYARNQARLQRVFEGLVEVAKPEEILRIKGQIEAGCVQLKEEKT